MRHVKRHTSLRLQAPLRAQRGLTLIELMVGLAIAAILALTAAPFLGDYLANSRLRESGHALYTEALFAQSEAQKRNSPVGLRIEGSVIRSIDLAAAGGAGVTIREFNFTPPVAAQAVAALDFSSNGRPAAGNFAVNLVMEGSACSAERRCPGLRIDAGGAVRLCGDYLEGCD
jgi:type IV fimbrial biogenesis protein FimT